MKFIDVLMQNIVMERFSCGIFGNYCALFGIEDHTDSLLNVQTGCMINWVFSSEICFYPQWKRIFLSVLHIIWKTHCVPIDILGYLLSSP